MLIPFEQIYYHLKNIGKPINGILHIGAHECEEKKAYNSCGITDENIFWVEGNPDKVELNKEKGVPNIIQALVYDKETNVDFHITSNEFSATNTESSSILQLGTHLIHHPYVQVKEIRKMQTKTLSHLINDNNIPITKLNFWNLDIQGVELEALKSSGEYILHAEAIYLEVNVEQLYQGCALLPEVEEFLNKNGFVRAAINITDAGWGDALFIRVH
jgi:FkbM family methyltransferase